jgi:hypothetical protein
MTNKRITTRTPVTKNKLASVAKPQHKNLVNLMKTSIDKDDSTFQTRPGVDLGREAGRSPLNKTLAAYISGNGSLLAPRTF